MQLTKAILFGRIANANATTAMRHLFRNTNIKPLNLSRNFASAATPTEPLKRTALYDFHVQHGGKMVPFAGYEMPVLYSGDLSIRDSHLHTRSFASLFDVSHMLQLEITGKNREQFFESLIVADLTAMPIESGGLTLYTTDAGGIIDDLIVTRRADSLYVVSNAARSTEDMAHLRERLDRFRASSPGADVQFKILDDRSLLALQGPTAHIALQKYVRHDLSTLKFMNAAETSFDGGSAPIRVTRCGYTGEDGFELSISDQYAVRLAEALLDTAGAEGAGNVRLAGLGARDSLRLEAGLCLYGNDIDETTTPIEAKLTWTIAKRRRATADFPGASIILKQLKDKPSRRRVGLIGSAGPPVRAHSKVFAGDRDEQVGVITSGCPAPSLGRNIAMAYVDARAAKNGTKLRCEVRGKLYEYEATKMPFVATHYYV